MEITLNIDFRDAVFGVEREIRLTRKVKCQRCKGEGAEPGSKIETCKTCGGTGRVARVQRTILGNVQMEAVCEDCRGEGKKYDKVCSVCRGSGAVQEISNLKISIPAGINDGGTIRYTGEGEAGEKGAPAGDLYVRVRVNQDRKFKRVGDDIVSKKEISFTQAALGDKVEIETVYGSVTLKIPEGTQSGAIFKLKEKGVTRLNSRVRGDHLVEVIVKIPRGLTRKQKKILEEFRNT